MDNSCPPPTHQHREHRLQQVLAQTLNATLQSFADFAPEAWPTLLKEATALGDEVSGLLGVVVSSRLALYAAAALVFYVVYLALFRPLALVRRPQDVGYLTKPRQSTAERMSEVTRRRLRGDLPPVYPNGWYELCQAASLAKGEVKQVTALGREFCVFRGQSGKVGVLDAYCPHLGANIAAGGTVEGDCVQCPFHGWKFDLGGTCVEVPYAESVPAKAATRSYPSLEINDQVLLWFDAEGRPPSWTPPVLEYIASGRWSYRGLTQHPFNAHIQEVPENAADIAHLNFLHGPSILSGTDLRKTHQSLTVLKHNWEADWAPNDKEDERHISTLHLYHYMTLFGVRLPPIDLRISALQVGPSLVYLSWKSFFGSGVFVQSILPEEPLQQVLTHRVYCDATVPTFIAKFFMGGEAAQVERDMMVWNNKRYVAKPMLAKEDHLIARHRKWYSQFYSDNSPRIDDAANFDW